VIVRDARWPRSDRLAQVVARCFLAGALLACAHGAAPPPADERAAAGWAARGDAAMERYRETRDLELVVDAETAYRRAVALDARSADALAGLAWVHGVEHAFEESLGFATRALALDPQHARAHGLVADAALELGRPELAAQHVQAMLDLRPDLASLSRAAQLLERTGDPARATLLMRRAIAAGDPRAESTAWCRAELARMLWQRGALLPAQRTIDEARALRPEHPDVLATAAALRAAQGDHAGAIDLYEHAVARGAPPGALASLGDLYGLAGRLDQAERAWARAEAALVAHAHDAQGGNLALARFLAERDRRLDVALREAEAAHRQLETPEAADVLAWTYHRLGRHEEAQARIAEAVAAGAPTARLLFHAGMIEASLGHRLRARQLLYEALNLNPTFDPIPAREAHEAFLALAPGASADAAP
jgi:tetratricopeptide (TPR) repeat protein